MKIEDILKLDGVIIRKIPKETVSYWTAKESDKGAFLNDRNRWIIKKIKQNSLGGKYILTFDAGQGQTVVFNLKHCGTGDTILAAYSDYLSKKENEQ